VARLDMAAAQHLDQDRIHAPRLLKS
jgi:hypothetical protein